MNIKTKVLIKPFELKLTLTIKGSIINSSINHRNSSQNFDCEVKGMTIKDFYSINPLLSSHHFLNFFIDLDKKSVIYTQRMLGGGNCKGARCTNPINKQMRNSINMIYRDSIDLQNALAISTTLLLDVKEGYLKKDIIEKLNEINPFYTKNQIKIFYSLCSSFLNSNILDHPMLVSERYKLAVSLRNYFIFSYLDSSNPEKSVPEDQIKAREQHIAQALATLKNRKSIEEYGTIAELEIIVGLRRRQYWTKINSKCKELIKIILDNKKIYSDLAIARCENFLLNYKKNVSKTLDYLPTLLEFFGKKAYSDKVDYKRDKFIKRLFSEFKDMKTVELGIAFNYLLNCIEKNGVGDNVMKKIAQWILRDFKDLDKEKKIRCCFFMKIVKLRFGNWIKDERKKFMNFVLDNENDQEIKDLLFSPKFLTSMIRQVRYKPLVKDQTKTNLQVHVNFKSIIPDSLKLTQINQYYTRQNFNIYSNVFFLFGDRSLCKTQLSLNYIKTYQDNYDFIFSINCSDRTQSIHDFNNCCKLANSDYMDKEYFGFEKNLRFLNTTQKLILLVLDEVQNLNDFQSLYIAKANIKYLVLSRSLIINTSDPEFTTGQSLIESSATFMLSLYLNDYNSKNSELKKKISSALHFSPYYLKLAASLMVSLQISLEKFLKDYLSPVNLINFPMKIFNSVYEKGLKSRGKSLIKIVTYFEPDCIPVYLLEEIYESYSGAQDFDLASMDLIKTLMVDEFEKDEKKFWNVEASFIKSIERIPLDPVSDHIFYIIKQKLTFDELELPDRWKEVELMLSHVKKMVSVVTGSSYLKIAILIMICKFSFIILGKSVVEVDKVELIVQARARLEVEKEYEVMFKFADLLSCLGLFGKAESYFSMCLEILNANKPLDTLCHFDLYLSIGNMYKCWGQYPKSYSSLNSAAQYLNQSYNKTNLQLYLLHQSLIDYHLCLSNLPECQINLQICQELLKTSSFTSNSLFASKQSLYLSILYQKTGKFEESDLILMQILKNEALIPPSLSSLTYLTLGQNNLIQKIWLKSLEYLQKSCQISEIYSDPLTMAQIYRNFADLHKTQKEFQLARKLYNLALGIMQVYLNEFHLDFSLVYIGLGEIELAQRNLTAACEFLNKAFTIRVSTLGNEHWDLAGLFMNFGDYFRLCLDHTKAVENYMKALRMRVEVLQPSHPDLIASWAGHIEKWTIIPNHQKT